MNLWYWRPQVPLVDLVDPPESPFKEGDLLRLVDPEGNIVGQAIAGPVHRVEDDDWSFAVSLIGDPDTPPTAAGA